MRGGLVAAVALVLGSSCASTPTPESSQPTATPTESATAAAPPTPPPALTGPLVPATATAAQPSEPLVPRAAACAPADWAPRSLKPPLSVGKKPNTSYEDRFSATVRVLEDECTDAPNGPQGSGAPVFVEGVEIRLASATPAGKTGRHWAGNQCAFELRLADGAGRPVTLGPEIVPPFNSIISLVHAGSAAWLVLSFNGYTREFPKGGNRVVAVNLCEGRVAWTSKNSQANTSLLLVGDYLFTAFGFTSEPRFVYALDARSGAVVQKLKVLENVCPSKSWAPNWDGGRCDAPGQLVGATTNPRIEGGLFFVDTNTGSAAFELR